MKKYGLLLLFIMFFLFIPQYVQAAEDDITIKLNGQLLQVPANVKVESLNNSIMVPIRVVVESFGFEVKWNQKTQLITIYKDGRKVELTIGSTIAQVDGVEKKLLNAPVNRAGTSLVPLRFVSETMGLNVGWDNKLKVVSIQMPIQPDPVKDQTNENPPTQTPSDGEVTTPSAKLASLEAISFSGNRLMLAVTGSVKPSSFVMTNKDRIIINLPSTQFSSTFGNGQASDAALKGELVATGYPNIEKIRYSLFTNNPATVRIVIDLKEAMTYSLSVSGDASSSVIIVNLKNPDPLSNETEPSQPDGTLPDGSIDGTVTGPTNETQPGSTVGGVPLVPGNTDNTKPGGSTGKKLIVIDAGHGAHDPGTIGFTGKKEKDFNLALVLKIESLLKLELNMDVILTRSDDTFVTRPNRAQIANDLHADAFISIHANSVPNAPGVSGTESYYYNQSSKALTDVMHANLLAATGLKDRKVKYGDLQVLRESVMPATLLEVGFLSNEKEEATLFNEEWQLTVAKGIVAGIKQYFAQPPLTESTQAQSNKSEVDN